MSELLCKFLRAIPIEIWGGAGKNRGRGVRDPKIGGRVGSEFFPAPVPHLFNGIALTFGHDSVLFLCQSRMSIENNGCFSISMTLHSSWLFQATCEQKFPLRQGHLQQK